MTFEQDIKNAVNELDRLDRALLAGMQKGTDAGAEILAAAVKSRARTDSGKLASEIGVQAYKPKGKNDRATRVTLGPFYRAYLELGTSRMPAYPFIQPAYVAVKTAVKKAVQSAIDDAVDRAIK